MFIFRKLPQVDELYSTWFIDHGYIWMRDHVVLVDMVTSVEGVQFLSITINYQTIKIIMLIPFTVNITCVQLTFQSTYFCVFTYIPFVQMHSIHVHVFMWYRIVSFVIIVTVINNKPIGNWNEWFINDSDMSQSYRYYISGLLSINWD